MTIVLHDTFTDANLTTVENHTPDTDTVGGGWTSGSGQGIIIGNRCAISGQGHVWAETNLSDFDLTAIARVTESIDGFQGILFRSTGAIETGWFVALYPSADEIRLYEWAGATPTLRDTYSVTIDHNTDYTLLVECRGQTIDVSIDGVSALSYGSASWCVTETRHGLLDRFISLLRCDEITVTSPPRSPSLDDAVGIGESVEIELIILIGVSDTLAVADSPSVYPVVIRLDLTLADASASGLSMGDAAASGLSLADASASGLTISDSTT